MKKFAMDMFLTLLMVVMCVAVAGEEIVDVMKELTILWIVLGGLALAWIGFCLHRAMNPPRPEKEEKDGTTSV